MSQMEPWLARLQGVKTLPIASSAESGCYIYLMLCANIAVFMVAYKDKNKVDIRRKMKRCKRM